MAPRDSSHDRHRDTERRHGHKKKKSREHSSRRAEPNSEATSSGIGSGTTPKLSLNALAQLNDYNTSHLVEEHRKERSTDPEKRRRRREERPPRTEYRIVEPEYDPPVATSTKERRRRTDFRDDPKGEARRARRMREALTDAETENETPRKERIRRKTYAEEETDHDSPRKERRRREVHTDAETEQAIPRRERRKKGVHTDVETDYESPKKERRRRDVATDDDRGRSEHKRSRDKLKAFDATSSLFGLKRRVVSGAVVEEGRAVAIRGGAGSKHTSTGSYDSLALEKEEMHQEQRSLAGFWKQKKKWIISVVVLIILIIIIAVAVVVAKEKESSSSSDSSSLDGITESDIPAAAQGTYLDPFTWYTTTDFNVTYTNETVGDLPIMGLNTDWDDSAQANGNVPALNEDWGNYTSLPARGVNLGGWLSLEPWITPSLFNYNSKLGIVDEYTLCTYLGTKKAASTLEEHYATFVTEDTFSEIVAAGLDHVRIPYSYWAVQTYDQDPYIFRTSWRYLLRAIEWCRKYGLRVNLDLHGLPGSQNGWNHSGRLGAISWLNGTDGDLNAQRSLDVHDRLSKFFAQDRYKNIIKFYGLANEPKMTFLDPDAVVNWTSSAFSLVRSNGIEANVVFGDGFMGLENWQGKLTGLDGLVLDVHQYVIFNNEQIIYTHKEKVDYACSGWTEQTEISMNTSTGYGPTMFAEWSQADTDCATYLNNVGWGNRWEGTYDSGNMSTEALTPKCPYQNSTCSCDNANDDVSTFSTEYKQFLKMFAQAQMVSFEKGWGWWYWTWDTESAPLWSYKQGLAAGILPTKAYEKDFSCNETIPDFAASGLPEVY